MRPSLSYYLKVFILGFLAGVIAFLLTSCGRHSDNTVAGPKGDPGAQGPSGQDGVGCTQYAIAPTAIDNDPAQYGGALITCQGVSVLIRNGAKGDKGQDGVQGARGQPGAPGAAGANGIDGVNGTNGVNGVNGHDGTLVTAVKFCPQYSSNSGFPEYGIEFGGQLFAVYWDQHNAWLALVTPGYYASTSTGAPCTFIVNNDGTVAQ